MRETDAHAWNPKAQHLCLSAQGFTIRDAPWVAPSGTGGGNGQCGPSGLGVAWTRDVIQQSTQVGSSMPPSDRRTCGCVDQSHQVASNARKIWEKTMWPNVQHSHIESHNASDRHAGCRLHAVDEEKGGMCGRRRQEGSAANCQSRREACDVGNRPREIRGSVRGIPVNVTMPTTTRTTTNITTTSPLGRTAQQIDPRQNGHASSRGFQELSRPSCPVPRCQPVVTNLMEDLHPNCWNRCGTAPQQRSSS